MLFLHTISWSNQIFKQSFRKIWYIDSLSIHLWSRRENKYRLESILMNTAKVLNIGLHGSRKVVDTRRDEKSSQSVNPRWKG